MKKLLKKIYSYTFSPIKTFKSDLKLIHFYYSKFFVKYIYKIDIEQESRYFYPNYSDLYNLINLILKYNPKKCIEVGGGYSTFVILKALETNFKKDGVKASLISMEQSVEYINIHKNYLKNNLSDITYNFLDLRKTELVIDDFLNTKVSKCTNLELKKLDFFYEDRTDHPKHKIAGDAIMFEHRSEASFIIVIDGMIQTSEFYKKNLKGRYNIKGGFFNGTSFIPKKN